jgi:hypothetical protein
VGINAPLQTLISGETAQGAGLLLFLFGSTFDFGFFSHNLDFTSWLNHPRHVIFSGGRVIMPVEPAVVNDGCNSCGPEAGLFS